MNNKWLLWGILPMLLVQLVACDDEETYAELKEKERDAVNAFILEQGINVISYDEFIKDTVTNVDRNEYVLVEDCYMQIVRNPKGTDGARQIKDGETLTVIARFSEYNISEGDTILSNLFDSSNPDYMRISRERDTYSATFTDGYMYAMYGSSVPTGWLVPMPYIYFTRFASQYAKVNLIVPHTEGTSTASSYVYPCFYTITFIPQSLYDTY